MHPDIHRAALRVAARLALSAAFPAALAACGATPDQTSDTGASSATESDLKGGSGATACVKEYCSEEHHGASLAACCKAEVADATFPQTPHMGPDPDKRVDELTRGCCTVLAKAADKAGTFSWPERTQCCDAIGWSAAATCTPWGPPVPPAMNRRSARRLLVA